MIQRYLDWEKAKFYRFEEKLKGSLGAGNLGPTTEEWDALTKEYERLKAKYDGDGILDRLEEWAIWNKS